MAQAGGESKDATETLKQKEFARLDEQLTAQRKTLQNEKAAEEEALKKQISAAQASLQRQYDSLKARLDNASAQYKELTDKISDLRQKAQDDAENSQHETVTHFDSFTNYNTDLGIDVDAGTVAEDPSLEERRAKTRRLPKLPVIWKSRMICVMTLTSIKKKTKKKQILKIWKNRPIRSTAKSMR